MKATLEPPSRLSVGRRAPSPDPLPVHDASLFDLHAPWLVAAGALICAVSLLEGRDLGLLACGAGCLAVIASATQARLHRSLVALHFAGGVITLSILRTPTEAGELAVPAAVLLVAALLVRAAALTVRSAVAPLAGRLPWRFQASYRTMAMRFGLIGFGCAAAVALLARQPLLAVAAVALLPLALRVYIGTLLSKNASTLAWTFSSIAHLSILAFLVPTYGAAAAAWGLVVGETVLFASTTYVVARRTGAMPLPRLPLAICAALTVVIVAWAFPVEVDWLLVAGIALGFAAGPWVWRDGLKNRTAG